MFLSSFDLSRRQGSEGGEPESSTRGGTRTWDLGREVSRGSEFVSSSVQPTPVERVFDLSIRYVDSRHLVTGVQ